MAAYSLTISAQGSHLPVPVILRVKNLYRNSSGDISLILLLMVVRDDYRRDVQEVPQALLG